VIAGWRDSARTVVGAAVDRALLSAIVGPKRRPPAHETFEARLHRLASVAERYNAASREMGDSFFGAEPAAPNVTVRDVGPSRWAAGRADLSWRETIAPIDAAVGEALDRDPHNREARARWITASGRPRPAIILVHGYLGGDPEWESRFMPARALYEWGFDVALATLPYHGPRKDPARKGPPKFPAADAAFNVEVFRRAIFELRGLVSYALSRGAPSVGVLGMSLGGYTSALLASAEPRLSLCVPMIPLASMADFTRDHGRLPGAPSEREALHAALDASFASVSPLHRPCAIEPSRVLVLAAAGDRITPPAHAARLARHTGGELVSFAGGHLLQLGRSGALERVRDRARALGVLGSG
jgi:pimeloyl-ACP methyl ester carboxylesterase